jgi:UDP-N-acetyl-2-amino-2-deoxyglucuronate dehydrogenase
MRAVGGDLVAALDPNDAAGILDRHFPNARFFVEFERFDRFIDLQRQRGEPIDYVSICSPNYLHDAHMRFALRSGAHAICEKPLVLNPWNLDGVGEIEKASGRHVNAILQVRHHPAIVDLRNHIARESPNLVHDVEITYITSRGPWYYTSWKGDEQKAGGIATNIGVHFFDMLCFIFGRKLTNIVHHRARDCAAGYLEFERARVRWFLSINRRDLPRTLPESQQTYRSVTVDHREIEFSEGFTDLHTVSYQNILAGRGFSIEDVRPSVDIVSEIRIAPITPDLGERHSMIEGVLSDAGRYRHGWPI